MKKTKVLKLVITSVLAFSLLISAAGCKKKPAEETTDTSETEETTTTATTTAVPTTSLTEYSGPLPSNDIPITWTETEYDEPVVRYVATNDYMNVRKGPGTEYDSVARFYRGMAVTVVAYTQTGWLRTEDGFYISGDFVSTEPVD
ncbi:MAG: hypothetical protein J5685_00600 [Clostridiales bacterium]|nr:hypothetical protein [Clostridiales bacterium]